MVIDFVISPLYTVIMKLIIKVNSIFLSYPILSYCNSSLPIPTPTSLFIRSIFYVRWFN